MEHTLRGRGRDSRIYVLFIIEKYTNNLSGTDGIRFLCHQFSTSSLLLLANCISRFSTCSLTMKHMTLVLLRLLANDVQGQNTRNMVFPLNTDRWSCILWWSRRNRSAQWRQHTVSRKKRSVASFVLVRKCIYSKKRNGPICHDGYARRVFLLCSRRILSIANTMALLEATSLFSYKGSSQPLSTPTSKVVGVAGPLTCMGETRVLASLPYSEYSR